MEGVSPRRRRRPRLLPPLRQSRRPHPPMPRARSYWKWWISRSSHVERSEAEPKRTREEEDRGSVRFPSLCFLSSFLPQSSQNFLRGRKEDFSTYEMVNCRSRRILRVQSQTKPSRFSFPPLLLPFLLLLHQSLRAPLSAQFEDPSLQVSP